MIVTLEVGPSPIEPRLIELFAHQKPKKSKLGADLRSGMHKFIRLIGKPFRKQSASYTFESKSTKAPPTKRSPVQFRKFWQKSATKQRCWVNPSFEQQKGDTDDDVEHLANGMLRFEIDDDDCLDMDTSSFDSGRGSRVWTIDLESRALDFLAYDCCSSLGYDSMPEEEEEEADEVVQHGRKNGDGDNNGNRDAISVNERIVAAVEDSMEFKHDPKDCWYCKALGNDGGNVRRVLRRVRSFMVRWP